MTIKEAFQKLSQITNAGIKNPWFVIRNLGQTFADVADKIEDGGGASQDYSTTEQVIGKWIDGITDVYEKTIVYTPESTISSATAIGTITNADIVIIHEACGVNASQNRMWMLPMGGTTDISYNSGSVYLNITNDSWSTDWTFYVTVRYTKAS